MCKSYICSLNLYVFLNVFAVEAYAASWIEITRRFFSSATAFVEAYAASWIEILSSVGFNRNPRVEAYAASWIEITGEAVFYWPDKVEAYAASWIEIQYLIRIISNNNGRGLRSLVD